MRSVDGAATRTSILHLLLPCSVSNSASTPPRRCRSSQSSGRSCSFANDSRRDHGAIRFDSRCSRIRSPLPRGCSVHPAFPFLDSAFLSRNGRLAESPIVDLTLLASISLRRSFVCVAVSETLQQLRYEQHGLSAPVRKRTHRVGAVPCVPYAAASRASRSCTFYRQDHRPNQRRQLPGPLQSLLARDQVPSAMGI